MTTTGTADSGPVVVRAPGTLPQDERTSDVRATTTRDDSGQMMTALVIGLCMTLLAFLVVAVVPLGAATNDKTRSQTAADAAALAAADELRRHWVDKVTDVGGLADPSNRDGLVAHPVVGGPVRLRVRGNGFAEASRWAGENGSEVTPGGYTQSSNRYPVRVQVEVEVQESSLRDTRYAGTGPARSEATAEVDVPWNRCSWSPRPPEPTLELGGRPTYQATLTCGSFVGVYEVHNSAALGFGFVRRITDGDVLLESVDRPRLVE